MIDVITFKLRLINFVYIFETPNIKPVWNFKLDTKQ